VPYDTFICVSPEEWRGLGSRRRAGPREGGGSVVRIALVVTWWWL